MKQTQQTPRWDVQPSSSGAKAPGVTGRPMRREWMTRAVWAVGGLIVGVILTLVLLFGRGSQQRVAKPTTTTGHLTITMDDAFLTQFTRAAIQQAQLPVAVSNVNAHIQAGNTIAISGEASLPFVGAQPVNIQAQPYADGGYLKVRLLNGDIGGEPLPTTILQSLQNALNKQLAQFNNLAPSGADIHYAVSGVSTTDGHMLIALNQA
ncbi:MAG: hypothetical protein ABI068_01990 [Ktedonobacterales bacterium]